MPTLVLVGRVDSELSIDNAALFSASLPAGHFVIVENAGHSHSWRPRPPPPPRSPASSRTSRPQRAAHTEAGEPRRGGSSQSYTLLLAPSC